MTRTNPEHAAIVSGIDQSEVGRRLGRGALDLTLDACLQAIEDAGLTRDGMDGLTSYPGAMSEPPGSPAPAPPRCRTP
jgi:hypothetical protein